MHSGRLSDFIALINGKHVSNSISMTISVKRRCSRRVHAFRFIAVARGVSVRLTLTDTVMYIYANAYIRCAIVLDSVFVTVKFVHENSQLL